MNQTATMIQTNPRDVENFMYTRFATESDDKEVAALLLKSFIETNSKKMPNVRHNEERIFELFDVATRRQHGKVLLVELGKEIVATCALIHPGSPEGSEWTLDTAYLRALAVDPNYHGLGLSRRLLDAARNLALEWRVQSIALHVQRGADGVARVYQKYGFTRDERGDTESCGNEIDGWIYDLNS